MLDNLPVLVLEKVISALDFESKQNLVKSAKNNQLLKHKLENFKIQTPCPFCVLKRLSSPPLLILWRKLGFENDDDAFEIWLRMMSFCTNEDINFKHELQWSRYDVSDYEDKLNGFYIDDDLNDISFESLITDGYFDKMFTIILSAPYKHFNDYEGHILSHFRLCSDKNIGKIQTKAKMWQVIKELGQESQPFVDPKIYETVQAKKKIRLETNSNQSIREDMEQILVRLISSRFLYNSAEFMIGKSSGIENIDIAKYFNKEAFRLLTDIRFVSNPCTHLNIFINNNRLLARILSRISN